MLNGCGRAGIGQRASRALVGLGFDVVRTGNADNFDHARTLVIDRSGREERAHEVAAVLGCGEIRRELRSDASLDVTVVVGTDFDSLRGLAGAQGGSAGAR